MFKNLQDHRGCADYSGVVPGPLGQKRRKEVFIKGKAYDSVYSRAWQHKDNNPHQAVTYSATSSSINRKRLITKSLTLTAECVGWRRMLKLHYPKSKSLCVYEVLVFFFF